MNVQTPSQELVTAKPVRTRLTVVDPIDIMDTARYEHMQRIAMAMASTSMVPDALRTEKIDNVVVELPQQTVVANCFMVVNQAVRWGMDPFAVAQCVSVVHGKLCYEGKLIAAVLEAKLGIRLDYEFDDEGEGLKVKVVGRFPDEDKVRHVKGSVAAWKVDKKGSPWTPHNYERQCRYRGAREWARAHAPGTMLGVITDDEMEVLSDNARSQRARDVTPARITVVEDSGPPDPSEVDGGGKPAEKASEKAAEITTEQAVAVVEAGRDDGKQVVWGDDDPPPPDAVEGGDKPAEPEKKKDLPTFLDRRSPKAILLDEISQLKTPGDFEHYRHNMEFALLREKLNDEEAIEVSRAVIKRKGDVQGSWK